MRLIRYVLAILPVLPLMATVPSHLSGEKNKPLPVKTITSIPVLYTAKHSVDYNAWHLASSGLSKEAFDQAIKGYDFLLQKKSIGNPAVLTIIDYSKPSTQKRLFVLDMQEGKILFKTLVAHGHNSGLNYATDFSNEEESHKSSLGFYVTGSTYTGANGYSLKLNGCEKGINDNAGIRAIVLHGADYVSDAFIRSTGYLGRSYGCPAVPLALHKKIIDKIKNGSCIFLYYPTKKYSARSKILDS